MDAPTNAGDLNDLDTRMTTCDRCGGSMGSTATECPACGALLSGSPLSTADPSRSGQVFGAYRLIDRIGIGGMGEVYLAEHTMLGRRVAVKMLRRELSHDARVVARFFTEARAVNQINHQNIVEVTDFVQDPSGDNYFVMEYLIGESLRSVLAKEKTLPLDRVRHVGAQIATALAAAHEVGIVHRDLKPDNIFLLQRPDAPDFVKILDFGVAKLMKLPSEDVGMNTAAGSFLGTVEYMSPEQISGAQVGPASDVYSLGVVLYELVCGQRPFKGKNFGELVIKHLTMAPPPPSRHREAPDDVSRALDKLIMQCLAKRAEERPVSMSEVAAALAVDEPTATLAAPKLRSKSTIAGVGFSLLLLVSVMAWALWPARQVVPTRAPPAAVVAIPEVAAASPAAALSVPEIVAEPAPPVKASKGKRKGTKVGKNGHPDLDGVVDPFE